MDVTSYSSDESNTTDETDESGNEESPKPTQHKRRWENDFSDDTKTAKQLNIVQKLHNREAYGSFSGRSRNNHKPHRPVIPNRLRFCLKDVVPPDVERHLFMGLSACGQFMLSYTVDCNDNIAGNHYSFNLGYKYTLYFWIFQPHKQLKLYYKSCLFDDHGVDNTKEVTMTQWKCTDPRVLIVHGAGEEEGEDSFITYVKVPKLGCLDCKKMREGDYAEIMCRIFPLCLKCSLTVHTKYSTTDSDRKFNPHLNLLCPERIIIIANGLVHMLHIGVAAPPATLATTPPPSPLGISLMLSERRLSISSTRTCEDGAIGEHTNHMVQRILSDFSDIETDSSGSVNPRGDNSRMTGTANTNSHKYFQEWVFTCNTTNNNNSNNGSLTTFTGITNPISSSQSSSLASTNSPPKPLNSSMKSATSTSAVSVCSTTATATTTGSSTAIGKRHQRIVTKSYRNAMTGSTLSTASTAATPDRASAYEFSEDNEKCEKIATLRKRRLADKKYEFSEDNSENIIPFTKIRMASKSMTSTASSNSRNTYRYHYFNSPSSSPSSSTPSTPNHMALNSSPGCESRQMCSPSPSMHRGSPIMLQGFRSPPCSSGNAAGGNGSTFMRSPSRSHAICAQTFKPLGTLSPLQLSMTKRNHLELGGSMSPNGAVPFLSPRREEQRIVEVPLQGGLMPEKPVCTKKFKRRYVEEDDAASVITSEEDDCISPGYHTSLPMEVHGSLYADMQMISQASYLQLRCPSVVVTQHSFDIEAFTYYVLSALCQKNNKIYDVFYDWAYEPISVCPRTLTIFCLLIAQFSALDQTANSKNCATCINNFQCCYHRNPGSYEGRILFTWNMETGDWKVLDYGELIERKTTNFVTPRKYRHVSMQHMARKLAQELGASLTKVDDHTHNLRVLDSNVNKSKFAIIDTDNMVEFHLKRPRTSDA